MKLFLISAALLLSIAAIAQPPSAEQVMSEARKEAVASGKNVFIIFHASWCGWCRRMDSTMNEPAMKPLFSKNYVIRHLTVLESQGKKDLENPGAKEMMDGNGGEGQGIPFWLIFDKDGKLLANSRVKNADGSEGGNTGCPATEDEVGYFIQALKKTSRLKEGQLNEIRDRFLKIRTG